jgi:hypothetical protein
VFFGKSAVELINIADVFLVGFSSDVKQTIAVGLDGINPCIDCCESPLNRRCKMS